MDAFSASVYIYMFLRTIQQNGYMQRSDMNIAISDLLKDPNTKGTIRFYDSNITGLDTMKHPLPNGINVTENTDLGTEDFDVCLELSMDVLDITTKYVADISLWERIPIYGEGNLSISISDVVMNLCTFASHNEAYVDKMNLRMSYRHGPISITGLYRHSDVDRKGSMLLNNANILFAMWNSYEPEKASCVLSPIMQYLINEGLHYEHNSLKFDYSCLQESAIGNLWKNSRDFYRDVHDILYQHQPQLWFMSNNN